MSVIEGCEKIWRRVVDSAKSSEAGGIAGTALVFTLAATIILSALAIGVALGLAVWWAIWWAITFATGWSIGYWQFALGGIATMFILRMVGVAIRGQ